MPENIQISWLAGGDWGRIAGIIEVELAGEDVTVVEYKQ